MSDKVAWDGLRVSFAKFEKIIDGHLLQVGMHYALDKDFQRKYKSDGMLYCSSKSFQEKFDIPIKQVQSDKMYLYGIMKSCTRSFEDKTTNEYEDTQDGFAVWIILKQVYAYGGNVEIKVDSLEHQIYKAF